MFVDRHRIVAIKAGHWSNQQQDWLAVLVTDNGAEIETQTWLKDATKAMDWTADRTVEFTPLMHKPW